MARQEADKKLCRELRGDLESAERVFKRYSPTWKKWIRWYEGDFYGDEELDKHTDYVNINLLKAYLGTLIPAVYFRDPKVYIKATRPEHKHKVPVTEALLNYWIKELDMKTQIRRSLLDWALIGHGWLKVGYFAKIQEETPAEAETEASIIIRDEQPFVRRVSPFDMLVDPAATTYEEVRWLSEKILMDVDEAYRKWPELKKVSALKTFLPDETKNEPEVYHEDRWKERERRSKFVKLDLIHRQKWNKETEDYEIWATLLAEGHDRSLMNEKMATELEGFPYEFIAWDERIDRFYPQGVVDAAEEPLIEYNKLRSMELNHMKRSARQYIADAEIMTPEIKAQIQSGVDGLVITVDGGGRPLQDFIQALDDAPLNPQISECIAKLKEEIREIIGLDDFIRGQTSSNITATQASIVNEGTNMRVEWRRGRLHDFIANTLRKVWKIIQQYHDAEDIIAIVGDDGVERYATIGPEEISGEFSIDIGVNSTAPPNKQMDIKNALDRYNLLRGDPKVDARRLIFDLLTAMGVQEIDKMVKAPEELEGEHLQKESEALNQGQKILAHPGDDHEMHMQAHQPEAEKYRNVLNQLQQHTDEISRQPDGPEKEDRSQELQGYNQEIQQIQQVAGAWQDHLSQHQRLRDSDMGVIASGADFRPGQPINPNMFNRRATRLADTNAEFQGG